MKRFSSMIFFMVFLALGLVGCQQPPTAQLTQADQALAAANQAEAATYAVSELTAATDALAAARSAVDAQNEKFAMFRDYKEATRLITEAQSKADAAKMAAVAGKEKARNEAEASLTAAQEAVSQAQAMVAELTACTPYPKGFAADLALTQGRVDSLGSGPQSIQNAIQSERYFDARSQAETFLQQVQPLLDDMSSVKSKLRCRGAIS